MGLEQSLEDMMDEVERKVDEEMGKKLEGWERAKEKGWSWERFEGLWERVHGGGD